MNKRVGELRYRDRKLFKFYEQKINHYKIEQDCKNFMNAKNDKSAKMGIYLLQL